MQLHFDVYGNLSTDIVLATQEFRNKFGYNPQREKQIQNLFIVAKTLASFGCDEMYVDGSFVTVKEFPNDIDVCFNITHVDEKALQQKHAEFFKREELNKIHDLLMLHVFFVTDGNLDMVDFFRRDRNGNKKGIVKIFLKELLYYDKERKAI